MLIDSGTWDGDLLVETVAANLERAAAEMYGVAGGPRGLLLEAVPARASEAMVEKYKKRMASSKQELQRAGVDVSRIERAAKKKAAKVVRGGRKAFAQNFSDALRELVTEEVSFVKFSKATFILVMVVAANELAFAIMFTLFGGGAAGAVSAFVVMATVVAPMVEEWAKNISIREGFGGTFLAMFNAAEFLMYVARGASVPGRLLVAGLHYVLAALQRAVADRAQRAGDDEETARKKGFVVSAVFHGLWNFGNILPHLV